MPRILLVDDSKVDRMVAERLLRDEGGHEVECVEGAREALESIAARIPDLVVTDLVMPEMDGLELIGEVRDLHSAAVPVIVFTSKGSEEIAVRALEAGAASYVPKRVLQNALLDTVDAVLSATAHVRRRSELLEILVESRQSFLLENDRELFRPLIQHLQASMAGFGLFDDSESTRMGMAIEEALNNALEHGNLELDSSQRDVDMSLYVSEMRERCQRQPYRDRRIHLDARLSRERASFTIRDDGAGFDPTALRDPLHPENLDATSGRGILLMRMFMDEVTFNGAGNQVTLEKRR